jgi:Uma2 family endonuclease
MSLKTKTETTKKTSADHPERRITGEELYRMGDIGPAELVKGRIVRQMPTGHPHGFIESLLVFFLLSFIREHKIGRVLTGEVGIYTQREPDTIRAADIVFISNERYQQASPTGYLDVAPELVVEIMSPSNTWSEAHEKLADYFAIGVQVVWMVDPQLEQIHVYRAPDQVTLLHKADTLRDEELLPGFEIKLTEIFVEDAA